MSSHKTCTGLIMVMLHTQPVKQGVWLPKEHTPVCCCDGSENRGEIQCEIKATWKCVVGIEVPITVHGDLVGTVHESGEWFSSLWCRLIVSAQLSGSLSSPGCTEWRSTDWWELGCPVHTYLQETGFCCLHFELRLILTVTSTLAAACVRVAPMSCCWKDKIQCVQISLRTQGRERKYRWRWISQKNVTLSEGLGSI